MPLKFGTSGVRGLVTEMTDRECYLYTLAFVQHVSRRSPARIVSLAGDLRSSTPRILRAVSYALQTAGIEVDHCGFVSTSALTYHAMLHDCPSIMVTGSHIPDDRNGIKFNLPWGEILKEDEEEISKHYGQLKHSVAEDSSPLFTSGYLPVDEPHPAPKVNRTAEQEYVSRYLDFFPANCLSGLRVLVYEHSSVSRDVLSRIFRVLGAEVITEGRSDVFVPVDTEAVSNSEEIGLWIREHGADALVSTDGDGDRPLLFDEHGRQVRGDVLGILVSEFLGADSVSVPVSCSSSVEHSGFFRHVARTRIGSPFVISSMLQALEDGYKTVVGFEANGGFLTASNITSKETNRYLLALPTRDAILPLTAALRRSILRQKSLSQQISELPSVFTSSGLIKEFPTELGQEIVDNFRSEGSRLVSCFLGESFGNLVSIDFTDGARMVFSNGDVVHLRPSGNAPEFRCYTEARTQEEADANNREALEIVDKVIRPYLKEKGQ